MMMGPLISEAQRSGVEARAAGDRRRGHRGHRRQAARTPAQRLLLRAHADHRPRPRLALAQDEVFGPVLVVLPYRDDDDAVAIANNSIFGLSGPVFGADDERATNVARRIRSGTMSVNGGMFYGPTAVRWLQAVGHRPRDGRPRPRGVPRREDDRPAAAERGEAIGSTIGR